MDHLEQKHHTEDIGRILLQTQQELREIRAEISGRKQTTETYIADATPFEDYPAPIVSVNPSKDLETLQNILDRAEREIQAKVDLLYKGVAHYGRKTQTGLPFVASPPRQIPSSANSSLERKSSFQELSVDLIRKVSFILHWLNEIDPMCYVAAAFCEGKVQVPTHKAAF